MEINWFTGVIIGIMLAVCILLLSAKAYVLGSIVGNQEIIIKNQYTIIELLRK